MYHFTVSPRFSETDALGHVNNTVLPVWFEDARTPILKLFVPELKVADWSLIVKKVEIEFTSELFYGFEVEIKTSVIHIGNSSFSLGQEAWQNNKLSALGKTVLVHFDYQDRKSVPIPEDIRSKLEAHRKDADEKMEK